LKYSFSEFTVLSYLHLMGPHVHIVKSIPSLRWRGGCIFKKGANIARGITKGKLFLYVPVVFAGTRVLNVHRVAGTL